MFYGKLTQCGPWEFIVHIWFGSHVITCEFDCYRPSERTYGRERLLLALHVSFSSGVPIPSSHIDECTSSVVSVCCHLLVSVVSVLSPVSHPCW